mmetsp:Transcript_24501/g.42995  ORF Transcript_24501/g.42995 Transcript_24501/m.42995 type:complete len:132 (-) Transcript_24501:994-1389(-)
MKVLMWSLITLVKHNCGNRGRPSEAPGSYLLWRSTVRTWSSFDLGASGPAPAVPGIWRVCMVHHQELPSAWPQGYHSLQHSDFYALERNWFHEDLAALLDLLKQEKIEPVIACKPTGKRWCCGQNRSGSQY